MTTQQIEAVRAQLSKSDLVCLGGGHLEWILAQPNPAITAHCRAVGMWDANNLAMCATYERLEKAIKAVA